MKLPFGFVGFASFSLVAWCRLSELSWLLILSLGRRWRWRRRRRGTAVPARAAAAGTGSAVGHGHRQSRVALVIHFSFIRYKMVASWRGTARCEAQRLFGLRPRQRHHLRRRHCRCRHVAAACAWHLVLALGCSLVSLWLDFMVNTPATSTSTGTHTLIYAYTHRDTQLHMDMDSLTCTHTLTQTGT